MMSAGSVMETVLRGADVVPADDDVLVSDEAIGDLDQVLFEDLDAAEA
jgi:hypothetical protein